MQTLRLQFHFVMLSTIVMRATFEGKQENRDQINIVKSSVMYLQLLSFFAISEHNDM